MMELEKNGTKLLMPV